uniref:Uncharacterized protein n=1 Tax=viral metagenome TaxID=1070528 RepID=A0A6M3Y4M3_9ZZZZ
MTEKKKTYLNKFLDKFISEYKCCLEALGKDDPELIEKCEKKGHISHKLND